MPRSKSLFPHKGSVLVFALVILAFSLVAALSVAVVSVTERRTSFATEKSSRSFQVADSGIEVILYTIYKKNDVDLPPLPPKYATLSALANAIDTDFVCNSGEILDNTGKKTYVLSFYSYDSSTNKWDKFTECGLPANPLNYWRVKVTKIKSEGTSGNTTRAVEVGLSALPLP